MCVGNPQRRLSRTPPSPQRRGFSHTDEGLRSGSAAIHSGTTALAVVLLGRTLHVGNAGDCRAVLCRRGRAIDLSEDHKPSRASEAARIKAAGGFVDCEGYLNGSVAVSRALGDWHLLCPAAGARGEVCRLKRPPGDNAAQAGPLTGECDVFSHELTAEDEFLLLACDGFWDVMSSQTAVELARQLLRQHNDPARLAAELVKEAIGRHTGDNVTVIAVCLGAAPPPARAAFRCSSSSRLFSRCFSTEALADVQRLLNGGGGAEGASADEESLSPLAAALAL